MNGVIAETVENLDFSKKNSKKELLAILKKEASEIDLRNIMLYSAQLQDAGKYLETNYKENFIKTFRSSFINRLKCIKGDKKEYTGYINNKKFQEFLKILEIQREIQSKEDKSNLKQDFLRLSKIAKITSIYVTFMLKTPIHPVGTLFPGVSSLNSKMTNICVLSRKKI